LRACLMLRGHCLSVSLVASCIYSSPLRTQTSPHICLGPMTYRSACVRPQGMRPLLYSEHIAQERGPYGNECLPPPPPHDHPPPSRVSSCNYDKKSLPIANDVACALPVCDVLPFHICACTSHPIAAPVEPHPDLLTDVPSSPILVQTFSPKPPLRSCARQLRKLKGSRQGKITLHVKRTWDGAFSQSYPWNAKCRGSAPHANWRCCVRVTCACTPFDTIARPTPMHVTTNCCGRARVASRGR